MKKRTLFCLIALCLLCGCNQEFIEPTQPTEGIAASIQTEPPSETVLPTEPPSEPVVYFDIEAGSYLEKYTDKNTNDYLEYYLFIPENATINMPLIVFLHGDGEVGAPDLLENYGLIVKAREIYGEKYPFIAIYPCTRVASWTDGTIPDTLKGLIDETVKTYSIDTEHIILTGHSRGAIGTWYLLGLYGDYFSAAVPISCGPGMEISAEKCAEVPVLAFVGSIGETESRYKRAMQKIVNQIVEIGGTAELIVLDQQEHHTTSTAAYTAETFEWMLSQ